MAQYHEQASARIIIRRPIPTPDTFLSKNSNASIEYGKRMLFRIGINLGDVIVDGDDILGGGVNVAARLEAIAEPVASTFRRMFYRGAVMRRSLSRPRR
jgi:class 3 adenylate cyclase